MKNKETTDQKISRKEAIQKMGKYAAITAIGTFAILNPVSALQSSKPDPGGNPFD